MSTPKRVAKSFRSLARTLCGLKLDVPKAGHWMLLEDIQHPVMGGKGGLRLVDYATAGVLLAVDVPAARELAADPERLRQRAMDLCDAHSVSDVRKMAQHIIDLLDHELDTGNTRPAQADTSPAEPAAPADPSPPDRTPA